MLIFINIGNLVWFEFLKKKGHNKKNLFEHFFKRSIDFWASNFIKCIKKCIQIYHLIIIIFLLIRYQL